MQKPGEGKTKRGNKYIGKGQKGKPLRGLNRREFEQAGKKSIWVGTKQNTTTHGPPTNGYMGAAKKEWD